MHHISNCEHKLLWRRMEVGGSPSASESVRSKKPSCRRPSSTDLLSKSFVGQAGPGRTGVRTIDPSQKLLIASLTPAAQPSQRLGRNSHKRVRWRTPSTAPATSNTAPALYRCPLRSLGHRLRFGRVSFPLCFPAMACVVSAPTFRLEAVKSRGAACRARSGSCLGLDSLAVRRNFLCHHSFSQKVSYRVRAATVTASPTFLDNAEERKLLAEKYGFMQIGKPLPDNITMKDIMDTLPKKLFEIDDMKAWRSVLISVTSYALGIFMIAKAPWYLLPLAWAWTGTAITGFFVIGHDCAHKAFSRNKLVEDIVGTLAFLPLIYPYEPWRFKHDRHHAKTNMLSEDTAWHPVMRDEFESSPLMRKAIIYGYGPLKTWMSITHWLIWHFNLKKFRPAEIGRVKISLACVFAFMAIGWPLIIYKTGITGWIKFWLMPWLGYHFWMSTFTMVHHTAPHIPFKTSDEWNAAQAQLNGTVHCNYPHWIEILCHDINVHIPHHISSKIPSYNLREAHKVLQNNWGEYLSEANWNWRLMKTILTLCHVYDHERYYVPFDEIAPDESYPIQFLKETMPDYA